MNPDTTVYIPVPLSERPSGDGTYMTKWKGVPAFTEKEFKKGEWQTRFDHTNLMTEWLKPVPLSELLAAQPIQQGNVEVLVKSLREIVKALPEEESDNYDPGDIIMRVRSFAEKAIYDYQSRTSVKGEEKKYTSNTRLNIGRLEVNCFNEDSEMSIKVGVSRYQSLTLEEAEELNHFLTSHIHHQKESEK